MECTLYYWRSAHVRVVDLVFVHCMGRTLVIPFWIGIIVVMENRLLNEVDRIIWDDVPDDEKVRAVQRLMYQWGACQDNKTDEMFGDDDAHINSPNMRRI